MFKRCGTCSLILRVKGLLKSLNQEPLIMLPWCIIVVVIMWITIIMLLLVPLANRFLLYLKYEALLLLLHVKLRSFFPHVLSKYNISSTLLKNLKLLLLALLRLVLFLARLVSLWGRSHQSANVQLQPCACNVFSSGCPEVIHVMDYKTWCELIRGSSIH